MSALLVEVDAGVARVTLNRPDVLNAINDEMGEGLVAMLERVRADDVRAVLITGAGRAFSAGADLGSQWRPGEPVDLMPGFERVWNPVILGLRQLSKPVLTAVNGAAVGYSAALALSGDVIVASEKAFFLTAAASAGIMPDGGLTALLPASLGLGRAASMVFLGERLTAAEAHQRGFIARVCAPEELQGVADEIVTQLAAGPTLTYAATKRAFNAQAYPQLAEQLALEARLQQDLTGTHDYMEGTAAFTERRAPNFTGT